MSKSLYSLILTDEVVKRIDTTAEQIGTNRSNLVNQILADYVSYITPEEQIRRVIEHIEDLLSPTFYMPGNYKSHKALSIKTSIECKYKPTVKYSVELYDTVDSSIGKFKVTYRTHTEDLLYNFNSFFLALIDIEKKFLKHNANYNIADGKFIRTFVIPTGMNYSQGEIARAISDYVKNFDRLFKNYLYGKYARLNDLEYDYKLYMAKSMLI